MNCKYINGKQHEIFWPEKRRNRSMKWPPKGGSTVFRWSTLQLYFKHRSDLMSVCVFVFDAKKSVYDK